jgi:sulfite exporter TauE/SafE
MLGLLTIVVGLVMLFFGAQLTELFPRLSTLNFTIPSGIARLIGLKEQKEKEYSHKNAMVLGGLSFFLPCGFTQVVQLYAISTGNPLAGALTMGVFAIGTTPGLLGIGGLTSLVKGAFAKPFFKFVGIVVIALSFFNISNGLNLSGLKNGISLSVDANAKAPTVNGDVQVLKSTYTTSTDIQPNSFTVKAGQPVRMELDVQDDGSGCMGSFAIPGLSSKVEMLNKGNTLVYEFTPESTGTFNITCAMGVPRGSITVI